MEAKDLTNEAPRSPKTRLGGYAILGRTIDKCRAFVAGTIGEYHFDCPLDNMLFAFKGLKADEFKKEIANDATDEEMVTFVNTHGMEKTPLEVKEWSEKMDNATLLNDPEKREAFIEGTKKLGLDPKTTTLFQWLEADDKAFQTAHAA